MENENLANEIQKISERFTAFYLYFFGDPKIVDSQENSLSTRVNKALGKLDSLDTVVKDHVAKFIENDKKQAEHNVELKALTERVSKLEQWQDRRETEAKTLVKMADVIKILGGAGGGSLIWYLIDSLVK